MLIQIALPMVMMLVMLVTMTVMMMVIVIVDMVEMDVSSMPLINDGQPMPKWT